MRTIPAALQVHLDGGATTMCYCWRVTRTDGLVQGFTDHDEDLTFLGTTFSAGSGFTATQISKTLGLSVDNLEVKGALSSATINEDDLAAGKYDDAYVELYWVNWADPTNADMRILQMNGYTGEAKRTGTAFQAELRGLSSRLGQATNRVFQRTCDATVGDSRCRKDLNNPTFKGTGAITQVVSPRVLKASGLGAYADKWFNQGVLTFSSSLTSRCIISSQGLMVNAFHNEDGRQGYFAPPSGTSEGQFLGIYSFALAAAKLQSYDQATASTFATIARTMGNACWKTLYRGKKPSDVALGDLYVPHWLFTARSSIQLRNIILDEVHSFTAYASGQVQTVLPSTAVKGYQAYDVSGTLLWNNPYSVVLGGATYTVDSLTDLGGSGYRLVINTGTAGNYKVAYTTSYGPVLAEGMPYEAWPAWRALDDGEIDCAADTMRWALDAYTQLSQLFPGSQEFTVARQLTSQSIPEAFAVDDGRAIFKRRSASYGTGESGLYIYNSGRVATWARNSQGYIKGSIGAGSGEAQLGRGYDIYLNSASDTILVQCEISAASPATYLYVDTAASYSPSTRYYYELGQNYAGTKIRNLTTADFKRIDSDSATLGSAIVGYPFRLYGAGFTTRDPQAMTFTIFLLRPQPMLTLPYQPYVVPFTINMLGPEVIDWRGSPGTGYQAPDLWGQLGSPVGALTQLQFLQSAQAQWQTDHGNLGPFAHCYIWDRHDRSELGNPTPGTWTYTWHDPNSQWGGYQYRPLESCARLMAEKAADPTYSSAVALAKTLVQNYLSFLNVTAWPSLAGSVAGPPTDFTSTAWQRNYEEPHFAALILRTATYALRSGLLDASSTTNASALVSRSWTYLESLFQSSGAMGGTWSTNPAGLLWYGFWNAEIVASLALLLDADSATIRSGAGIAADTVVSRLRANATWLVANTRPRSLNDGISIDIKSHTNDGAGNVYIELWYPPAFDLTVGWTFEVTAGCDLSSKMCHSKFNNIVNFQGFNMMPGSDTVIKNVDPAATNEGSTTTSSSKG